MTDQNAPDETNDSSEELSKMAFDALNSETTSRGIQFKGEVERVIIQKGDHNLYSESAVQALRVEIKYLKKLLELRDNFIKENSEANKNLVIAKDAQIDQLKDEIAHLHQENKTLSSNQK